MTLITGFTCPPTIYFKFITKCDKCYYKVRQLFLLQSAMVCYYKVRRLLQSATVHGLLLQSATASLLQSARSVITKCDRHYKGWQFYYKVRQVLQSATIITKCDSRCVRPSISKCDSLFYYKVRQLLLQSAIGITKCDRTLRQKMGWNGNSTLR